MSGDALILYYITTMSSQSEAQMQEVQLNAVPCFIINGCVERGEYEYLRPNHTHYASLILVLI